MDTLVAIALGVGGVGVLLWVVRAARVKSGAHPARTLADFNSYDMPDQARIWITPALIVTALTQVSTGPLAPASLSGVSYPQMWLIAIVAGLVAALVNLNPATALVYNVIVAAVSAVLAIYILAQTLTDTQGGNLDTATAVVTNSALLILLALGIVLGMLVGVASGGALPARLGFATAVACLGLAEVLAFLLSPYGVPLLTTDYAIMVIYPVCLVLGVAILVAPAFVIVLAGLSVWISQFFVALYLYYLQTHNDYYGTIDWRGVVAVVGVWLGAALPQLIPVFFAELGVQLRQLFRN